MAQVLVVDDEDDIREIVAMRVRRAGHEPRDFADPRAALAQAGEEPYQLALLDWSMPFMDGGELCTRLRDLPHLAHIPIVIVTAFTDDDTKSRAMAAGATGFLAKPFRLADLDQFVTDSLGPSVPRARPAPA
ncbi:response regulator [Nocardioides okcheonensis]|uniref:response regulator n=1 Tax=Nocardioides okcheonensis TaxID=2894081 RepID=UPI001E37439D|nr:response regulator [Nocardioides okcheonensis]UFN44689.1 response regulator [Nocardioides okcheonensis]